MAKLRAIVVEPAGPTYVDLIRFAEAEASTFSLVWRQQLKFAPAALEIKKRLRPSMIRRQTTGPDRPEDLAFYTTAGPWWLASIAHERQGYVDADASDVSRVLAAVPKLRLED